MKMLITIFLTLYSLFAPAQNVTGDWHGTLEVQGTSLRLVFHIEKSNETLTATLDSPDQGATNLATSETIFRDGQLTIKADQLGIVYEGSLSANDSTVEGTFTQGGRSMPLTLTRRASKKEAVVRPQDPTTFPYRQENVYFTNSEGNRLAGTLTLPPDTPFEQVVVLISGSGPQNRNEELGPMNHRPFLVLSDYLTRRGVAVLRYDDRGTAESEGTFEQATSLDFAHDAESAVAFLRGRADMKGKQIGLVGHSEGGMIAPMVASRTDAVDFIVLLAAPGIPIAELMKLQADRAAQAEQTPVAVREANVATLSAVYNYLTAHREAKKTELRKGLISVIKEHFRKMPEEAKQTVQDEEAYFNRQADTMLSDWFLYFINYDPAEHLRRVPCPVLAINGALDVQVPADENLAGIAAALQQGHNVNVTTQKVENQNHLFQSAITGAVSEYGQIEETFNEATMEYIASWLQDLSDQ